jgi:hypothetical protein
MLARHGGGDAQALGCGREALQLGDQAKHPHTDQSIHRIINIGEMNPSQNLY